MNKNKEFNCPPLSNKLYCEEDSIQAFIDAVNNQQNWIEMFKYNPMDILREELNESYS